MEYLADLIERESGVLLSLSTIKRLLSNDGQTPQPATLNALVSILNYNSWQDFKIDNSQTINSRNNRNVPVALIISLSLVVALGGWFLTSGFGTTPETFKVKVNGPVTFEADQTVLKGVPNTTIFQYDLKNVAADSFFIQQSWNDLGKTPVDQNGKFYSSIYYYPGFHRAKLIANDSIIRRKFVHITTDGWFPVTRYKWEDLVPTYLDKQFGPDQLIQVTQSDLEVKGVDTKRSSLLTYFNVKDFEGLESNNFNLKTRVRLDDNLNAVCPFIQVMVMAEQHVFTLPIVAKGCEGNIGLKIGEVRLSGRNNDLSAFGCNVFEWQNLQLNVENKHATIMLNGETIRTMDYQEDLGKIVGMGITFSGLGSIEFAHIEGSPLL